MINSRQVVGYKNPLYAKSWGFPHYGWDFNSSEEVPWIIASGYGRVAAVGYDNLFGNVVVVTYEGCELHDGSISPFSIRAFHMQPKFFVRRGQYVEPGQRLGIMGNTGVYTSGPHLHVTVDRDIRYPCYEPGIARNGQIIKRGYDTTIDPAKVFWVGPGQSIKNGGYKGWNSPGDYNLPRQ